LVHTWLCNCRKQSTKMKKGDYVRTKSGLLGKIVWDGKVPGKGHVFGLELTEWSENGNDGSYNGKHYFTASPGRGLFSYGKNLTLTKAPPKKSSKDGEISVGDYVTLRNGKEGTVKYVGCIGSSPDEVIGVKLKQWADSGHDGKGYFVVPKGYGYFAKRKAIVSCKKKSGKSVNLSKPKPEEKKSEAVVLDIGDVGIKCDVGDSVRLKRGREGVVKFIGKVGDKKLCGLELKAWSEKGNDGMLKDVRYFTCKPGRGYFTEYSNVAEVLVKAKAKPSKEKPIKERSPSFEDRVDDASLVPVSLGDKIELRKGRVGYVRYIGKVKGLKGKIIGLELLQWFDRGHNGTYGAEKYYSCKEGTGYWTSPSAVARVIARSKAGSPVASQRKSKSSIVATSSARRSSDLDEPIIKFNVNDVVRLKKGREGTVKYYNKKTKVVGLELKNWNADCGDGTFKGKEYFKCDKGRGYFTSAKAVNEILKRADTDVSLEDLPKREKSKSLSLDDEYKAAPVKFKMGDKVRLHRGRVGTVRYIGKTGFSKGVIVGLELDSWCEKGNDGTVNGKRFFQTRGAGWGYFTKPSAIAEVLDSNAP